MYPVSQDFHNQMKAQSRRIYGKIQVDYTDPFIDQSIQVSANENANYSYPEQVADNIEEPHGKIASLDGSWVLDGTYVLAPTPEEAAELQMGWWGSQLSDENGNYTAPYPTLSVTFAPRPIHRLQVIADNKRKEWPVNFTINLYSNDTLMHTETVTDNTNIFWSTDIERVNEITKMELIITKWSHANRQVKILEFFTSIQETYETDDILLINLLEEREVSQGSLPVGNISSNEIDIRLVNENGRFDAGNRQSPLYQLLKPNRRIKAWLRGEPAQIINPKPEGGHLWHFDRSVVSTDGIQPLSGAVYTLRPGEGKFGGAVAVEEGTENLDDSNWTNFNVEDDSGTLTVEDYGQDENGHKIIKLLKTAGTPNSYTSYRRNPGTIPDVPYSVSFEVKILSGSINSVKVHMWGSNSNPDKIIDIGNGWYRLIRENTIRSFSSCNHGVGVSGDEPLEILARKIQLEQKPFATSFVDGTRAAGRLVYPQLLDKKRGTLSVWINPHVVVAWNNFFLMNLSTGRFLLYFRADGTSMWDFGPDNSGPGAPAGTIVAGQWTMHTLTWDADAGVYRYYVNGEFVGERQYVEPDSLPSALPTVANYGALIDELLILPYAATEEEIARWYNSNAPFYDTEIKEWVPLGTFWSGDWTAPEGEIYVQTTGRDRLELLNQSTYSNSQVRQNVTLYDLAIDVLEDYGLEDYFVDEELRNTVIPFAYFMPQSHREALRKIAEACLGQCYCDRDGLVRLEGYSYLQSKTEPDIVITRDDYFMKDNPNNYMQIANYIEVETQPLRPAPVEEVYRSNEPVSINAGETISITAYYNVEPCTEAIASIEGTGSIADVTYYSWGADVKVTSDTAGTFELVINAKPLKVQGAEKIVAKDEDSIREHGVIKYTFPKNPLVQTREIAQQIADNLLEYYKEPRRDLSLEWRGNPALLLGDRIRIVDEYGGEDFFVTKQNIEYDGGLKVSMEGRKADGVE